MLGDSGRSYVVGFGNNYPLQPHHKAAACKSYPAECTWATFTDTSNNNPHQLDGALVGGPRYANDQYQDDRTDYIMNEVTLDYNAGFQSAVAGLKARACGSNSTGQTQPTTATTELTTSSSINTEATTSSENTETTSIGTEPTATSSATEQSTTITNHGCSGLTTLTNSWEGNVQGKLKIVVPTDISSFSIELETDVALTNINFYTAIASPSSGSVFTLTNYDWFSGLSAGQTLELDYQLTFSGESQPDIVKLTLNGQDVCSGGGLTTSNPGSSTVTEATTSSGITETTSSSSITESTTSSSTSCSAERYDYGEVLRLSNLFYEAQRSGKLPTDNRIPWRGDSSTDDKGNNGEDLSGGYHDGTLLDS